MYKSGTKFVIIGDSGVGKSSIIQRYLLGLEPIAPESTIGASFYVIKIDNMKFQVWDTAGQERFRALCPMYYRASSGCMCVFDITNRSTFNNIDMWIDLFKLHSGITDPTIILLANKTDILTSEWKVSIDEIIAKAQSLGCKYMLTSAVTGDNSKEFIDFVKIAGEKSTTNIRKDQIIYIRPELNINNSDINQGSQTNQTNQTSQWCSYSC
jgi:small GTP-binding protein